MFRGMRDAILTASLIVLAVFVWQDNRISGESWSLPWPFTHDSPSLPMNIPYAVEIYIAAKQYSIDPLLLTAVVKQESQFVATAISPAGAMGLGQLMPPTAATCGITDPFDPIQNLDCAAMVLRENLDRFGNIELALAAYNAGPRAVIDCGLCVPPNGETPRYVTAVIGYYKMYQGQGQALVFYASGTQYTILDNYPHVSTIDPTIIGYWPGRDFIAECGTPLHNPFATATVERIGVDAYGNTYTLLHSKDMRVMFMHGDYTASAGKILAGGAVFGKTGSNGLSSECHDHVSVRIDGNLVDPLTVFGR